MEEIHIGKGHDWCGKAIADLQLADNELITMVIRGDENLIPDGKTIIREDDIVVAFR